jgi:SAM-dependent methyltransferase
VIDGSHAASGILDWRSIMSEQGHGQESPGGNPGSGPGVITPDGCAVDFYALLPPGRESEIIHSAAGRAGASILELGSGTGRVTDALVKLGHLVVAVDESPEMLAHNRSAETVCARIQDLALGRTFDVVLLASHLLNVPDEGIRQALLSTCAQHVSATGCVIVQHHPPQWFDSTTASEEQVGEITFRLRDLSRPGDELLAATVEYQAGERIWTQTFTAMRLDEKQLKAALSEAGLMLDRYLTDDHSWFTAARRGGAGVGPDQGGPA